MENLGQSNNKNVSLSLIAGYGASDSDSDDTEPQSHFNLGHEDSESAEISEMVLKNNIINACAHGPLSRRANDREDVETITSRHMIIDGSDSGVLEYEITEYRDIESDSDSSSSDSSASDSSDSDVDSVKDIEELSSNDEAVEQTGKFEPPKVRGELELDDLPPIEDLAISLPPQDTTKIGTITSIVDRLVIIRAFPETPAVDLDSILFLDNGAKALGKVFDVFGPVTEPHYCVRFNSAEHVKEKGIEPGMEVFIAPKSEHTNYVFLSELMKVKGTDASWINDIEPPPSHIEYSDDEQERRANKSRAEQRRNCQEDCEHNGETSVTPKKETKRPQRPSESSSRFGHYSNRGRNPFSASRRNNMNMAPRFARPCPMNMDMRTPPPHPEDYSILPPPIFPVNSHMRPQTPWNNFHFGAAPNMPRHGPPPMIPPPFTTFANYFTPPGPPPQWQNGPPPPGT